MVMLGGIVEQLDVTTATTYSAVLMRLTSTDYGEFIRIERIRQIGQNSPDGAAPGISAHLSDALYYYCVRNLIK